MNTGVGAVQTMFHAFAYIKFAQLPIVLTTSANTPAYGKVTEILRCFHGEVFDFGV